MSGVVFDRESPSANEVARALISQASQICIALREIEPSVANRLAYDSAIAALRDAKDELGSVAGETSVRWAVPTL